MNDRYSDDRPILMYNLIDDGVKVRKKLFLIADEIEKQFDSFKYFKFCRISVSAIVLPQELEITAENVDL